MHRIYLLAWFVLASSGLQTIKGQVADSCNLIISGTIKDEHDLSVLDYSTILLVETGEGTAANEDGEFAISGVCPGKYTLRYSHVGCETRDTIIRIQDHMVIELYLEHHAELLEMIEVHAEGLRGQASQSEESISGEELEKLQGRSLAHALSQITGVNILSTGPNVMKPVLHGMHSSRILIFQNGLRQESQDWGVDHAPEIDPFLGDRLTVIKGAGAVQYGTDAMGGVILVDQRRLESGAPLSGSARLLAGSNAGSAAAAIDLHKGNNHFVWRVHGSGGIAGDAKAPDYRVTNTASKEYSFLGVAGFVSDKSRIEVSYSLFSANIGILRAAHIGNLTDLELALNSDKPLIIEEFDYRIEQPRQQVYHHILKGDGNLHTSYGDWNVQYGIQWNRRKEYDIRRGVREDIPSLDLSLVSHSADLVLDHKILFSNMKGKAGLSWKYQNNENIPGTGIRPLIPDYNLIAPAVYLAEQWISSKWTFELGLRYAFHHLEVKRFDENNILETPEFEYHNYAATTGIVWRAGNTLRASSNFGLSTRAPNVHELYSEGLHHGAAAIEEGDPSLRQERSLKWMQSVDWKPGRVHIELTAFQQWFRDFIYLQPGEEPRLTIRGAFPVFNYTQTDAFLWGTDVSVSVDLSRDFSLHSMFSMVRAEDQATGNPIYGMPADRMQHEIAFTPEKGLEGAKKTGIFIRYEHVWRQNRIPGGTDFAEPPNSYDLLHAGASMEWVIRGNILVTGVSVVNLLNASYREYLNRLRYFADEPGRNFELLLQYKF